MRFDRPTNTYVWTKLLEKGCLFFIESQSLDSDYQSKLKNLYLPLITLINFEFLDWLLIKARQYSAIWLITDGVRLVFIFLRVNVTNSTWIRTRFAGIFLWAANCYTAHTSIILGYIPSFKVIWLHPSIQSQLIMRFSN